MENINAQKAFSKSGLKSCLGTMVIELNNGKLAYSFSEKGFSNSDNNEPVIIDFHGNAVDKKEAEDHNILFAGDGFR